jgi:hypothetical protein
VIISGMFATAARVGPTMCNTTTNVGGFLASYNFAGPSWNWVQCLPFSQTAVASGVFPSVHLSYLSQTRFVAAGAFSSSPLSICGTKL